jgi:hypothetical protein
MRISIAALLALALTPFLISESFAQRQPDCVTRGKAGMCSPSEYQCQKCCIGTKCTQNFKAIKPKAKARP